ncbi:MAG: hypothetical protein Q4B08_04295, partial [Propionibacteriaceae bacterium]|nr:hypothetical protein [Propionibacteriaceae bacterium]
GAKDEGRHDDTLRQPLKAPGTSGPPGQLLVRPSLGAGNDGAGFSPRRTHEDTPVRVADPFTMRASRTWRQGTPRARWGAGAGVLGPIAAEPAPA